VRYIPTDDRGEQALENTEEGRSAKPWHLAIKVVSWIFVLIAAAVGKEIGPLAFVVYGGGVIIYFIGKVIVSESKNVLLWVMAAMSAQACWMIGAAYYVIKMMGSAEIQSVLGLLAGVIYLAAIIWFMWAPTLRSCACLFVYIAALLCAFLLTTTFDGLNENMMKGVVLELMIFAFVLLTLPLSYIEYRNTPNRMTAGSSNPIWFR
jgi:hypothetical protein